MVLCYNPLAGVAGYKVLYKTPEAIKGRYIKAEMTNLQQPQRARNISQGTKRQIYVGLPGKFPQVFRPPITFYYRMPEGLPAGQALS